MVVFLRIVRLKIPVPTLLQCVTILSFAVLLRPAVAQIEVPQFDSGQSVFDGWLNMRGASFPGISGGFPGDSVWTAPAGSNQAGSGDADLNKLSGSAFFASDSLYLGSYTQIPNDLGATFRVRDQTPLVGVRRIILQVQIGEAVGYDFYEPTGFPALKLNGSNSSVSPTFTTLVNSFQYGTFESPETGDEPLHLNTYAFEWILGSNATSAVEIEFSAVTHAQIYAIRLDQSTTLSGASVFGPVSPSTSPILSLVSVGRPTHDGTNTTIVLGFQGDVSASYAIEYNESLESSLWTSLGTYSTGNGTFSVTLTAGGDKRAAWSQKMFFRATRQ